MLNGIPTITELCVVLYKAASAYTHPVHFPFPSLTPSIWTANSGDKWIAHKD